MGQYIKIEIKRLFHTLPGFFPAVSGVLLLGVFFLLLAGHFLPEVLEVKPFRVGFCAEGGDMMSEYVREYVQQMESTEGLIEFCEMQSREIEAALREGELAAGIMIPERTAESIIQPMEKNQDRNPGFIGGRLRFLRGLRYSRQLPLMKTEEAAESWRQSTMCRKILGHWERKMMDLQQKFL